MSVVFQGNKTLYDENGRQYDVKMQSVRGSDKGFTKVWIADFMSKLGLIANKTLQVAFWLIEHADRNTNYINYSQRQIAEMSEISLFTVSKTMKALQEADFIRKVNKIYMLNPDVLYKNYSAQARRAILTEYLTEGEIEKDMSPEERIESLSKAIAAMQKKRKVLQAELNDISHAQAEKYAELENAQLTIDRRRDLSEKAEETGAYVYRPDENNQGKGETENEG